MFSAVRKCLYPSVEVIKPLPWVTCNFRLSPSFLASPEIARCIDGLGMNLFYGKAWSAAVAPTATGAYLALTVRAPIQDIETVLAELPDTPLIQALRADPGSKEGHAFPLCSAKNTKCGKGRVVLIGDSAHGMNPFCGAGASMALSDAAELVHLLTSTKG